MEKFLKYRTHEFFAQQPKDTLFVFETVGPIVRLATIDLFRGAYYFTYPGMEIKAITTKSCRLSDLAGLHVHYAGYPEITGKLMGHTGIQNTAFAYVFWDGGKSMKLPSAPALPSLNNLHFL